MTAEELLQEAEAHDVDLWFEGDRLRFRAPHGKMRSDLRAKLSSRRAEVLEALRERAAREERTSAPSHNQRGLWLVSQEHPDSASYNVVVAIRILSPLDTSALEHSLQALADRHAALRTTFAIDDDLPVLRIAGAARLALTVHDASHANEAALRDLVVADYRRPFDLSAGPLVRASLFTSSDTDHVLLVTVHHSVVDGWSVAQMIEELGSLYAEATGGAPASLGRPDAEYTDFVQWQTELLAGPEGERLWRFWEQALASPREEAVFPQDRHRAGPRTSQGGTLTFELDGSLSQRLRQLARSEDTTLYVVLLAAFQALLHRHTGVEDVIVGSPTFGRSRPEFSRVVGNFVNTVPLRTRVQPRDSFSALLRKAQRTVHDAIDAQDYPLPLIIERLNPARDAGRSPLFRTAFALQRFDLFRTLSPGTEGDVGEFAGLRVEPYAIEQQQGQFDVVLEMTDRGASVHGELKYSSELYDRDTMRAVLDRFIMLLESAVRDPGTPIEALEILPPAERTLLLTEWNRTDAPYPSDTVFVRLFEQQVQRTPQSIAISGGNARLTYRELDISANRLAHRLRELGVVSRSMVGVCLERTPDLLVALLGVQKAGGAYVPLDPSFPVERLRRMVSDSGARLVVTAASAPGELTIGLNRLDLDAERNRLDRFDGLQAPPAAAGPDDPAYVIYTSGSTGEPNGVVVSHGALVNFLWASRLAPGMSSSDVLGAVASMSFDISGFDFYLPLLVGARIALVDRTTAMDGAALAACFAREGVTTMVSTPSTWRLLLDAGWPGHARFRALVGGERWSRDLADALLDRVGELWNLYGPTETTIWSTAERIMNGAGPITIGRPIANTQVYVVDGRGEPVPSGVLGEICVGGAGVAIGYHRRETLTAERFVADPFRGHGRLYRTGDLGRWRSDGRLECVGRRDHQVKVRGHRIELGEIDAVLRTHDAVADAVVDAREAPDGDRRLVAYVVLRPGGTLQSAEVAAHLRHKLPDYMVPGPLVILDALPLSPTGKVDRKALPDPATAQADRAHEPPATATEQLLSAVWADVLDLPRVGRSDQFFELGGHSILVVSMLQRLGRLGVRVDVRTVFANPVLADLAAAIDMVPAAPAAVADTTPSASPAGPVPEPPPVLSPDDRARIASALPGGEASIEAICPLLPTQHGLLVEHLLDNERARESYVGRTTIAFDTRAGLDGFLDAVRAVIARHEALRTSLVWEGIAQPVQVIHRAAPLPVLEVDSTEATADAAAVAFLRIDPSRAPLIRAVVHPGLEPEEWRLTLAIHHLITDQTSTTVVMAEVRTILAGGGATLAPAPSYRAQVLPADESMLADHGAYFRELLGDVDEPTHVFGVADTRGAGRPLAEARVRLEADVIAALRGAAKHHGVTPAVICHVAAAIVVGACSGRDDVVFGTVLLGRSGQTAGADRTVGMFVNALPVRIALADADLAAAVKSANVQLGALLRHERAPLALAQQGSHVPASLPLFNVLFNYRRSQAGRFGVDGRVAPVTIPGARTLFTEERTGHAVHLAIDDLGETLWVSAQCVAEIDAARVTSYLCSAIAGVAAAMGGDEQVTQQARTTRLRPCDVAVLPAQERQHLIGLGTGTAGDVSRPDAPETLHGAFEYWAAKTPDVVAVADDELTWTYAGLDRATSAVASALAARGVGPGVRVGIALDRSVHLIAAVIGVLKAGGAYVPLDPNYPPDRLAFMVADSGASMVLTERARPRLAPGAASMPVIEIEDCLEGGDGAPPAAAAAGAEDVAYVIYTSGSTGVPKGVVIHHAAVAAVVQAYVDRFGLTRDDRWLALATLSFDPSVLEIFGPLSCGASLFVARSADAIEGHRLSQLIARCRPNYLQATPTTWRMLLEAGWQGRRPLTILTGGETLTNDLALELRRRCSRLFNVYGPTETTVWATAAEIPESGAPITVGRPFATTRVYVLDRRRALAPIGVQGEIYIGGPCVGRGYHNREKLTADHFVPDSFAGAGATVYRTGDLGRWNSDGLLECLGRSDRQLKVRGHRIELGEIEAVLRTHDAVMDAVVDAREVAAGDFRLAAYAVLRPGALLTSAAMTAHLRQRLPEYMVPGPLVILDALPLTPSGKVDRKALPDPAAVATDRPYEPPATATERRLGAIWEEILGIRRVGRSDHFFELGGHSILVVAMLQRLGGMGVRVDVRTVFAHPVLADLASAIDAMPAIALAGSHAVEEPLLACVAPAEPVDEPAVTLSPDERARIVSEVSGGDANIEAICQLLPTQHSLLVDYLLDPDGSRESYVARAGLAFDARPDLDRFLDAVRRVIARHEALRTALVWDGLAQPVQVIQREVSLPVLEVQATEATADPAAVAFLRIDPSRAPLVRAVVHPGPESGEWRLTLAIHHLITDQTSTAVVMDEVRTILAGAGETLAPAPSYRAHVRQPRAVGPAVTYFRELLGDVDEPTLAFGVAASAGAGLRESGVRLDAEAAAALRTAARRCGVTPAAVCHVAAAIVAGACSGREDVVFGTVLLGRTHHGADASRTVGMFVNALPVRIKLADADLAATVKATQAQLAALLPHEQVALAVAKQASGVPASRPLFNVLLNYRRTRSGTFGLDGRIAPAAVAGARALFAEERTGHAVHLAIDDLGEALWVHAQTVAEIDSVRVASYVGSAIRGVVAALDAEWHDPEVRVRPCDIDVLSAEERHQLLETFNAPNDPPDTGTPALATLHGGFEHWAVATPSAIAVTDSDTAWTYADLDRASARVAAELIRRGVRPGTRVAVAMERSVRAVAGVLGVLRAGAAYLALDPGYPPDRLALMLRDTDPVLALSERALIGPAARAASLPILDIESCFEATEPGPSVPVQVAPEDGAYIIYTSGSTGVPKGVVIHHAAAASVLQACATRFGMTSGDRWLQVATLSFDLSVLEIFGPLSCGASLYMAARADVLDPERLARVIADRKPTYLQATPTLWRLLVDAGWAGLAGATFLTGGEALTEELAERLRVRCGRLFNLYGPTETTIYCSGTEMREVPSPITVGPPLAGARVYVLGPSAQLLPTGVPGEVYVGGSCVGLGYHNRETLTAERFLPDPFVGGAARMYRSGDAGRLRADGALEILGRLDGQVKVRGHRIELGEVEAALERHPSVRRAAAAVRAEGADQQLVAWLATASVIEAGDLRRFLRDSLPEYMIPARFQFLESVPLTPNGKIDRRALPAFDVGAPRDVMPPETDLERTLVRLWEETLDVRPIGIDDNFFDLGGHSLLAARLCARLSQDLSRRVHVATLFQAPTVRELAARLGDSATPLLAPLRTKGAGLPYFCVPGAGDNAFIFADIARHLGADRPVYSFRFPEDVSASLSPHAIVEGVSRRLLEELRSAQPHGPYFLGGYCFGGLVAFDMALALRAAGEEVGALTIFEAFLPGSMWMSDPKRRLRYHVQHFQTLGWRERSRFIAEHASKRVARIGRRFSPASAAVAAVIHESDYSPRQVYPGSIALFRARHQPEGLSIDHDMGWKGFAKGGVVVHEIEGHHTGAYKEPTVSAWVSILQETLNDAERRLGGGRTK